MALINPAYSPEESTQRLIIDSLSGWYNQTKATLDNVSMLVWQTPFDLEPQAVFSLLGKEGVNMLDYAEKIKLVLEGTLPENAVDEFIPAEVDAKRNEDGTVIVSAKKTG